MVMRIFQKKFPRNLCVLFYYVTSTMVIIGVTFFYENGKELNVFNPIPDYFEDISMEQRKHLAGNSEIISKYFNIENAKIKNYLQEWTEDILEAAEKRAYEGDECCIGEDWQMADFMKAIGYSYDWEN